MPKPIRRTLEAAPPRWLRVRMHRGKVLDLHLLHELLLGDLLAAQATEATLWEHAAMVLTWSRAAQLLGLGEPEIAPQLDLSAQLIERWRRTGKVGLTGPERAIARHGAMVMDALAEAVDQRTATEASLWSEAQLAARRAPAMEPA